MPLLADQPDICGKVTNNRDKRLSHNLAVERNILLLENFSVRGLLIGLSLFIRTK